MSNNRGIYGGVPFGSVQTNFYDQQATSADGRLAYASDIDLCDAYSVGQAGGIGVGYGVKIVPLAGQKKRPGINDLEIVMPDSASTAADFGGILIRTMAGNTGADGENYMRENSMGTVLRKERVGGRIYIRMYDNFTAGNNAYWRIAERLASSDVPAGRICAAAITGTGTTPAVAASGSVSFTENPADGDTLQIGSTTYKFATSPAAVNDVELQASVTETIANLANVINGEFLRQMIEMKLTAAIINPTLKPRADKYARKALAGQDKGCADYIANVGGIKAEETASKEVGVFDAVLKGLKGECGRLFKEKINKDNFMSVIDGDIIPALNELGRRYEEGKAFLPQLIAGAESAKVLLDEIKASYMTESSAAKAVMLIATVKGDVHDIGKNIVKAVLSNYGYKIIDLGKDVGFEKIKENIDKYKPSIVGLSALMTTTLDNMADIVKKIKAYDKNIVVAVGGAVVTQSFADSIGADVYSKDAQEAVRKLEAVFGR